VPYSIEYSTRALVFLQGLPREAAEPLFAAIERLVDNPVPKGSVRLTRGNGELFSIRIRSWLVGYEIREQRLVIIILSLKGLV